MGRVGGSGPFCCGRFPLSGPALSPGPAVVRARPASDRSSSARPPAILGRTNRNPSPSLRKGDIDVFLCQYTLKH